MTKIAKRKSRTEAEAGVERPDGLPQIGRLYVSRRNEIYRVVRVYFTGPRHKYHKNEWRIVYRDADDENRAYESSFTEWESYDSAKELEQDTLEEAEAWALQEFNHPTLQTEPEAGPESTALTVPSTKQKLIAAQQRAEMARRRAEIVTRLMERKLRHFENVRREMESQLATLNQNIYMIELYLGVYEQVFTLRTGAFSPVDTPVALRQLVLYMDEEAGDTRLKNGQYGIDFQSVEDFDKWLLTGDNLARVLPEPKGVVLLCPSRQPREYSKDTLTQALMSAKNKKTYLLIRNGENLHRVYTNYIPRTKKLFPGPDEIASTLERAQKSGSYFSEKDAETLERSYIRNALILQGLFDRSEMFRPINADVNLFKPESYNGLVQFIYDAEPSLTDGHLSWMKWKDAINSRIDRGSRVILANNMNTGHHRDKDFIRLRVVMQSNWIGFSAPKPGVYMVETHPHAEKNKKRFVILYNPKDTVYSRSWGWRNDNKPHERKRRVSFEIEPNDYFVLNYDGVSLEDIEYFLASRIDRENYLDMMPTLRLLRDERLKELKQEQEFIKLVAGQNGFEESAVWSAVEWWKTKVIWKRPITKDDAKAWRMIIQKLKRESAQLLTQPKES